MPKNGSSSLKWHVDARDRAKYRQNIKRYEKMNLAYCSTPPDPAKAILKSRLTKYRLTELFVPE